jgi:hypothetical protein
MLLIEVKKIFLKRRIAPKKMALARELRGSPFQEIEILIS